MKFSRIGHVIINYKTKNEDAAFIIGGSSLNQERLSSVEKFSIIDNSIIQV